MVLLLVAYYL